MMASWKVAWTPYAIKLDSCFSMSHDADLLCAMQPPPSFQPLNLRPSNPTSRTATPSSRPAHTDLITRYNLASKINTPTFDASPSESNAPKKAWSQDRDERQKLLQRRREEMILAARRKMEEKDRAKSATTS